MQEGIGRVPKKKRGGRNKVKRKNAFKNDNAAEGRKKRDYKEGGKRKKGEK